MKYKKNFITVLAGLVFSIVFLSVSKAQVYNGSLYLESQAQINTFNYTEVTGNLWINSNIGNVVDLTPLSNLTTVGGILYIYNNPVLTNLDGLQNLTSVGNYVEIASNASLTNIDGLQSLTSIGGYLYLNANPALTNIDGLQNLTSLGGSLNIRLNTALTNIDVLQNFTSIGGYLNIYGNTALTNLDGLQNLTSVGSWFLIRLNGTLTNLDGLQSLTSVGGWFHIYQNLELESYCGIYPLLSEGTVGSIDIANNGANPSVDDIIAQGPCSPPPPSQQPYLLIAAEKVMMNSISQSFGSLHSNDKIELIEGPSSYTGNVTAVGNIDILNNITVDGDVFAGGELILGDGVTITGTYQGFTNVDPVDIPVFFFYAGENDINIKKNMTGELLPGTYGNVEVEMNGTLKLFTGEYFIEKLKFKKEGKLELDLLNGPITINVVNKVDFDKDVEFILLPSGEENSPDVIINSLNDIVVDKNSIIYGTFNAPEGKIMLKRDVKLKGALIAREIQIEKNCVLLHHTSPQSLGEIGNFTTGGNDDISNSFYLAQNHPNPFNPNTIIQFVVPEESFVKLEVYNSLGERIEILASEIMSAGNYEVDFNAKNLPSGVYFYRMQAGSFVETNKMILMK